MSRMLTPPDAAEWRRRGAWFWSAHDLNAGPAPLGLDARGEALLADLELAFCSGAWTGVILLAWALVEAVERERLANGNDRPASPDVDWLRAERNALAHGGMSAIDDQVLRSAAEGAVRTCFKLLFSAAWR